MIVPLDFDSINHCALNNKDHVIYDYIELIVVLRDECGASILLKSIDK